MVKEINSLEELNNLIDSNKLFLVDCYASWCGPCRMLAPIVEEISEEGLIECYKVDVDKCNDIATKYQIMSIPLVLFFKDKKLVNQMLGFRPKESLKSIIESIK